jgi:tRNA(fMet)-specific endonuclease VapC
MSQQRYLLDSNILSDLIRRPQGAVARKITALDDEQLCTSIVVACELRFGACKKASTALSKRVDECLNSIEVLALEPGVDRLYGHLRTTLEKSGRQIGGNDLLIAAHALATGTVLVTHNTAEFRRVPKLPVEDWLAD